MPTVEPVSGAIPQETAAETSRDARLAFIAAICVGLLSIGSHLPAWWNSRHSPLSWTYDFDTMLIRGGLLKAPRFLDTLHWWTGTWAGQVPFYRPLTSYLFWAEWKLGGDREWLYNVPGLLAHVAATALFGAVIYRLARRYTIPSPAWAAVIASWGFSGFLVPYRSDVTEKVFDYWKNQPDSFAAVCCFAALLSYMKAQQAGRSYSIGAATWYLAACGFKEIAVPLPFICACIERRVDLRDGRKLGLRRLAIMALAGGLFFCARAAALRTVGYTYGSNSEWLRRTAAELFGPFSSTAVGGEWLGNAVGVLTFVAGLIIWRRIRSRNAGDVAHNGSNRSKWNIREGLPVIGATFAGWAVLGMLKEGLTDENGRAAVLSPAGPIVGLYRCLQPVTESEILSTVVLLTAIAVLYKRHVQILVTGLVWTLAFLAPTMLSPGPIHRYYLSEAGYYLVYGIAAGIVIPALLSSLSRIRQGANPVARELRPG